jgi:uncharacterized YigZ family protein
VLSYAVPAREGLAEIEVKRSRFRCRVARVETEEAASTVVAEERRNYRTAGHHCSAFVLGPDAATLRSNDDGEPAGTAGAPILDALRGAGLSDVVAVVTRWFGGTLLGTGGLVQAYGDATRAALTSAGSTTRELRPRLQVAIGFSVLGSIEDQLRRAGVDVDIDYATQPPSVVASVPPGDLAAVTSMIMISTGGQAVINKLSPTWVDRR